MSDLVKLLIERGAAPDILAAVAMEIGRMQGEIDALNKRRSADAARQKAKRDADKADCHVTSRDVADVTDAPPSLDKETSPRPPKEINPIPRENRERVRAPKFSLPSDIPEVEWDGFEEMRKRIGKPMTDRARTLAISELRKLADAGFPPGDVLNHCTMNSYQGIFPPKDSRNGRQQSNRTGPLGPSLSAAERFASFGDVPAH